MKKLFLYFIIIIILFQLGNVKSACTNPICLQCQDSTPDTCEKCDQGKFLYDGSCYNDCTSAQVPVYQNKDISDDYKCSACQVSCKTCSDGLICDTCAVGKFKNANNLCEACPDPCSECSSLTVCSTCKDTYYLNSDNSCQTTCPDGKYPDSSSKQCKDCISNCLQCNDGTTCSQCAPTFYKDGNVCQSCTATNCDQCSVSNPSECSKCGNSKFLFNLQCHNDCSSALTPVYENKENTGDWKCSACQASCKTCINGLTCDTCEVGKFKNLNNLCESCPDTCSECSSLTVCSICKENNFLNPDNSCKTTCPDQVYPDAQSKQCKPCISNCQKCNDGTTCTQCASKFYKDEQNQCKPCTDANCYQCSDTDPTECSKCGNNKFQYNLKCLDDCDSATTPVYQNTATSGDWKCSACHASCKSCNNGEQCASCNDGYFSNANYLCEKCLDACLTCNSDSGCLTCKDNLFLNSDKTCKADCTIGYYPDSNTKECTACQTGCKQCTDGTSCQECKEKFYKDNQNQCQGCLEECATCSDATTCLSCVINKFLREDKSCQYTCLDGFYQYSGNYTCVRCEPQCTKCTQQSICQECAAKYYSASEQCFQCLSNCDECSEANTCQKCSTGKLLQPGSASCLDTCPKYNFPNTQDRICVACIAKCQTCTSLDDCSKCDDKFFYKTDTKLCTACQELCETCDNENTCLICVSGQYLLADNTCAASCPDTFYGDFQNRKCKKCMDVCKTCNDAESCSTCNDGYYFENPTCKKCLDTCKTCDSGTACKDCKDGLFLNKDKSCKTECGAVQYQPASGNICGSCFDKQNCLSCTGPLETDCTTCDPSCYTCRGTAETQCISCVFNKFFHDSNDTCLDSCNEDQFANVDERLCQPCYSSCASCSGIAETQCLNCKLTFFLHDNNKTCLSSCNDGFYADDVTRKCLPCSDTCATCNGDGANKCLSCKGEKVLRRDFSCNDACENPLSEFVDSNKVCQECDPSCKGCQTVKEHCLACNDDTKVLKLDFTCSLTCDAQQFVDQKVCKNCHSSCETCNGINDNNCLTCHTSTDVLNTNKKCASDCSGGLQQSINEFIENKECKPCDPTCKTCSGAANTDCTSCPTGKVFRKDHSCQDTCLAQQFDDSNHECQDCHTSCETCNGLSQTSCLSCRDATKVLKTDFSCAAFCSGDTNTEISEFVENKVCKACHSSCETCNGASDTQCIKCKLNYVIRVDNKCYETCETHQYPDNSKHCQTCSETCQNCSGSGSTDCTSCPTGKVLRKDHSCEATCPQYEFSDNNHVCQDCHTSCAICNGLLQTNCLTCKDTTQVLKTDFSCAASCDAQQFADQKVCKNCHSSCETCDGTNENNCLTCHTSTDVLNTNKKCATDCSGGLGQPINEFIENKECKPCNPTCKTCSGAANNDCSSCPTGKVLRKDNTCDDTCSQYEFSDSNHECQDCHNSCDTCNGLQLTNCLTCRDSTYVLKTDFSCAASCDAKQFVENKVCKNCHSSCETCTGAENTACTSCPVGKVLLKNKSCADTCLLHQYEDNLHVCQDCEQSCDSCDGSLDSNCLSCTNVAFVLLTSKQCNAYCSGAVETEINEYVDNNKQCKACHNTCFTCTGALDSECLKCKTSFVFRTDLKCYDSCESHQYVNSTNYCLSCSASCKECEGPNDNQCKSCNDGTYLETDKTCPNCHDSCKTCTGQGTDKCSSCPDGKFLDGQNACNSCNPSCNTCEGPSEKECLTCPDGSYFLDDTANSNGKTCPSCAADCATCQDTATKCLSCKDGSKVLRKDNTCATECEAKQFSDTNKVCQDCHTSCLTCDGPLSTNCLTCSSEKFYDVTKACLNCDETCLTCDGASATHCLTCSTNNGRYFLDDSANQNGKSCPLCAEDCATCQQTATKCLTCKDASKFLLKDFTCAVECPAKFYADLQKVCQDCHTTCKTCNGALQTNCLSCPTGTFLDGTKACLSCDPSCLTCEGAADTECLSCPDGSYFLDDTANSNGKTCPSCGADCATCQDTATKCLSCKDGSKVLRKDNTCATECEAKQFADTNKVCQDCHTSCLTCDGPLSTNCLTCSSEKFYDVTKACLNCDETCLTCDGASATHCLTCSTNNGRYFLDDSANQNGKSCPLCAEDCATCQQTATKCLTCKDASKFLLKDFTCAVECPTKFYADLQKVCQDCHATCETCNGALQTNCLTCPAGKFLDGTKACLSCHPSCLTCEGSAETECLSCPDGSYFLDDTANSNGKTCPSCGADCATCQDTSTKCLSCKDESKVLRKDNTCATECAAQQFADSNKVCQDCHASCATCSGAADTNCLSCSNVAHVLMMNFKCAEFCTGDTQTSINQFVNNQKQCKLCESSCGSCSGGLETNCLSCSNANFALRKNFTCGQNCNSNEYKDNSKVCQTCHESCSSCSGALSTNCLSCPSPKVLLKTFTCADSCAQSQFSDQNRICQDCHASCLTCQNNNLETSCLSCKDAKQVLNLNGQCAADCSGGLGQEINQFVNAQSKCELCHPSCKTCRGNSETGCLSCTNSEHSLRSNFTCGEGCNSNQFRNAQKVCIDCHANCLTCSGALQTQCLSCISEKALQTDFTCVGKCNDNQYENTDLNQCQACHETCQTCKGEGALNCLTCVDLKHVLRTNFTCGVGCDQFQFAQEVVCKLCHSSCKQCDGLTEYDCLSCKDNLHVLRKDGTCQNNCGAANEFVDNNKECQLCNEACATCQDTANKCLTCRDQALFLAQNFTCVKNCESNEYADNKQQCHSCHENCLTCNGPNNNQCLSCDYKKNQRFFFQENNTCLLTCLNLNDEIQYFGKYDNSSCVTECDEHYYISQETYNCEICDQTCQNCISGEANQCISCNEGRFLVSKNIDNICEKNCLANEYYDYQLFKCMTCPKNCAKCMYNQDTQVATCVLCESEYSLNYISNIKTNCTQKKTSEEKDCLEFLYYNTTLSHCDICIDYCTQCTSDSSCDKCIFGYTLTESKQCKFKEVVDETCSSGQYAFVNSITKEKECYPCSEGCSICQWDEISKRDLCIKCLVQDSEDSQFKYILTQDYKCLNIKCRVGEYYNDNFGCQQCPNMCSSCYLNQEIQDLICTNCYQDYGYEVNKETSRCEFDSNRCSNFTVYYLNNQCTQCPLNCKTCSAGNYEQDFYLTCLSCSENYHYNSTLQTCTYENSACNSDEFSLIQEDTNYIQCIQCPIGCETCKYIAQHYKVECKTCKNGFTLNDQTNFCESANPDSVNCTKLFSDEITLFDSQIGYKCKQCPINCQTCQFDQESLSISCLSCKENFTVVTENGYSSCQPIKDKFIISECEQQQTFNFQLKKCFDCPIGCKECAQTFNPNENINNFILFACSECQKDYYLQDNQCLPLCKSNQKLIQTKSETQLGLTYQSSYSYYCTSCKQATCLQCQMSYETILEIPHEICLQCAAGFYHFKGSCFIYPDCPQSGEYLAFTAVDLYSFKPSCKPCPLGCDQCKSTDPLSSEEGQTVLCQRCSEGFQIDEETSLCINSKFAVKVECTENQFQIIEETGWVCKNCPESCLTCDSESFCTSCKDEGVSSFLTIDNKCAPFTQTCDFSKSKFIIVVSEQFSITECRSCPTNCNQCKLLDIYDEWSLKCSRCGEGFKLQDNRCLKVLADNEVPNSSICANNEYFVVDQGFVDCFECPTGCASCNATVIHPNSDEEEAVVSCLSCSQGFKLNPIKPGSEEKICSAICNSNEYFVPDQLNNIDSQCQACDFTCLTCSGSGKNACTECAQDYDYNAELKLCQMQSNSVIDSQPDCGLTAVFSQTQSQCVCYDLKLIFDKDSQACQKKEYFLQNCNQGQFYNSTSKNCLPCKSKGSSNQCAICKGPKPDDCLTCVSGFFLNSTFSCAACSANCKICQSEQTCQQCQDGFYYYTTVVNGNKIVKCQSQCPAGTLPYIPSLYYLNTQLFSKAEIDKQLSSSTPQQSENTGATVQKKAIAVDGNDQSVFSNLPWQFNTQNQPLYNKQLVNLECIPCQKNCSTCTSEYLFVQDLGQCLKNKCPTGYTISEGACIKLAEGQLNIEIVSESIDPISKIQSNKIDLYLVVTSNYDDNTQFTKSYIWELIKVESDQKGKTIDSQKQKSIISQFFTDIAETDKTQSELIIPSENLQDGIIYTIQANLTVVNSANSEQKQNKVSSIKIQVKNFNSQRSLEDLGISQDLYRVEPTEGLSGSQEFKISYYYCKSQIIKDLISEGSSITYMVQIGEEAIPLTSDKCSDNIKFLVPPDPKNDRNITVVFSVIIEDIFYISVVRIKALKNANFDMFTNDLIQSISYSTSENYTNTSELQLATAAQMVYNFIQSSNTKQCQNRIDFSASKDLFISGPCNQQSTSPQCCQQGQCAAGVSTTSICTCSSNWYGLYCDISSENYNKVSKLISNSINILLKKTITQKNVSLIIKIALLLSKTETLEQSQITSLQSILTSCLDFDLDSKTSQDIYKSVDLLQILTPISTSSSGSSSQQSDTSKNQQKNQEIVDKAVGNSVKKLSSSSPVININQGSTKIQMKFVSISQQQSSLKSTIAGSKGDDSIPLAISKDSITSSITSPNVALVVATSGKGALSSADKDNLIKSDNLDISLNDPKTGKKLNTTQLSGTCPVSFSLKAELSDPNQDVQCVYYDNNTNQYLNDGCKSTNLTRIGQTNFYQAICCCNHMTKFAIGMISSPNQTVIKCFPPPPCQGDDCDGDDYELKLILGLSIGLGLVGLIGIGLILYWYYKIRPKKRQDKYKDDEETSQQDQKILVKDEKQKAKN